MNNTLKSLALAALTFPGIAAAEQGYYFGIGIGHPSVSTNNETVQSQYVDLTPSTTIKVSDTAFELYGGYQFDEHLAVEMDYVVIGEVVARNGATSHKLFSTEGPAITGMLRQDVNEHFTVFVKLGAHFWDVADAQDNPGRSSDGMNLTYGAGADINLYGGKSRRIRLQWNRYYYDNVFLKQADVATIGALFMFPTY